MSPLDDHDGWAIWQHVDAEDLVLVFQVHGAVQNAVMLTHPSIFAFSDSLVDEIGDNLLAFRVIWQENSSAQPAGSTPIVRLDPTTPLPCSIMAIDGGVCGRPAVVAYARPLPPAGPWAVPGLWELQPVCPACALAAAAVHTDGGTS